MVESDEQHDWKWLGFGAVVIVLAALVCYHRTFGMPFHFDGRAHVVDRADLDQLNWRHLPTNTRSLVGLTWRLNYRISGKEPWSYHAANLAIHVTSGLLFMGFVYLSLRQSPMAPHYRQSAALLAGAIALIWTAHPLQTQSVTYIVQRYESLMGMFFLLAMFCFAMGVGSKRWLPWYVGCIAATYLSGLCKEVAVVIPLVVLAYDATCVSQSWPGPALKRWPLYILLFSSWIIYIPLTWQPTEEFAQHNTVVVGVPRVEQNRVVTTPISSLDYLRSQSKAILFYIQLTLIPVGQSIDHGWHVVRSWREAALPGVAVLLLLGLTAWAMIRYPPWSFPGIWFFLILAPTSTILPMADIVFEHRMYLPSAGLIALVVLGFHELACRLIGIEQSDSPRSGSRQFVHVTVGAAIVVAVIFGGITLVRNEVYVSDETLWADAAEKSPWHGRARYNLARAYVDSGQAEEALPHLQRSIELDPSEIAAYISLGRILQATHPEQALQVFARAVQLDPRSSEAHNNIGAILVRSQPQVAKKHYDEALRLDSRNADAHNNLANLLARQGEYEQAILHYEAALSLRPDFELASNNLSVVKSMQARARAKNAAPR